MNGARVYGDFIGSLFKAMAPVKLGNVEFWVDSQGPWAGELSYDTESDNWDQAAIMRDMNSILGGMQLLHCEKDGEGAVAMGWPEYCELRQQGYSGTDHNDAIADAMIALTVTA